jgi:hypothetical protein
MLQPSSPFAAGWRFFFMFPDQGLGIGLRPTHYQRFKKDPPRSLGWVEAITENYLPWDLLPRPRSKRHLLEIRQNIPVALHGVSLSLGSEDGARAVFLKALKELADEVEPLWISDHLCWSSLQGENFHDLLPLPYTEEAIDVVVKNILRTQDTLKRRILIENLSSYVTFSSSEMTEWEFLSEVVRRADCGILLDINNVYVSSVNHGFDPIEYLRAIPRERIGQIHLAGHSVKDGYLIDTHDAPVCAEVWELFRWSTRHLGLYSTMIEWDSDIPELEVLEAEIAKAGKIRKEISTTMTNPTSLSETQARFAQFLKSPDGTCKGAEKIFVLPENSVKSLKTRIGVYQYAYFTRILESLASDYPELKRELGDEEFENLIRRYLEHYPIQSPILAEAGLHLPRFLAESTNHPPAIAASTAPLSEIAAIEWEKCLCRWSESSHPKDFAELIKMPEEEQLRQILILAPSIRFFKNEKKNLVFFKLRNEIKTLELTPSMGQLLGEIRTGCTLGELAQMIEGSEALLAGDSASAMAWISNWVAMGLICDFQAAET